MSFPTRLRLGVRVTGFLRGKFTGELRGGPRAGGQPGGGGGGPGQGRGRRVVLGSDAAGGRRADVGREKKVEREGRKGEEIKR